jgi:hypothetical protein
MIDAGCGPINSDGASYYTLSDGVQDASSFLPRGQVFFLSSHAYLFRVSSLSFSLSSLTIPTPQGTDKRMPCFSVRLQLNSPSSYDFLFSINSHLLGTELGANQCPVFQLFCFLSLSAYLIFPVLSCISYTLYLSLFRVYFSGASERKISFSLFLC